jgi:hypothetical protein
VYSVKDQVAVVVVTVVAVEVVVHQAERQLLM